MNTQSVEVIPGILEKTFEDILLKARQVIPFTEWIQIDLADGILVPNATFNKPEEFGTRWKLDIKSELHMMIKDPFSVINEWISAGFQRVIFHIEGVPQELKTQESQLTTMIQTVKAKQVEVGIALDTATPASAITTYLNDIDCVLIMTVKAGYSGQKFIPKMLEKVSELHSLKPDLPIEVDGGINEQTARQATDAGATRLVATSAIFQSDTIEKAIEQLKHPNH